MDSRVRPGNRVMRHSGTSGVEVARGHHDSGSQVFSDQRQDAPVFDSAFQTTHQHVMIDGIKERFQIAIDDLFTALLFRFPLHGVDRIVGTACRTKPVAVFAENQFRVPTLHRELIRICKIQAV